MTIKKVVPNTEKANNNPDQEIKEVAVTQQGVQNVQDEQKANTPKQSDAPKKRVKLDKDLEVECRSVVYGELIYVSRRTGLVVEWAYQGDIQYLTVEELMTMKSTQNRFLNQPWIIIEDEDVVEYLGLKQIYENFVDIENIEAFLLYSALDEIEGTLERAPKGIRELVKDKAREMVANETLYDNRVIKLLDKALKTDLLAIRD